MSRRLRGRGAAPVTILAALLMAAAAAGCAAHRPMGEPPRPATAETPPPPAAPAPVPEPAPAIEPPPAGWRDADEIRVGLSVGTTRYLLAGSKSWSLTTAGGAAVASGGAGDRIQISRLGPGAVEVFREGEIAPLWSGSPAETLLLAPAGNGLVGWSGRWYRGTFRVHGSAEGGLTLVNVVDLENYLRGVLPSEIGTPPAEKYEAVKAQAVAARSYTLSYLERRGALGFDLWATVEDQVYEGTKRENAQSDRALAETRGEVLVAEGVPIRALYSSTCGGRTSNVEDVWPWPWTSYLRSVRDAGGVGDRNEGAADAGGSGSRGPGKAGESYCAGSSTYRWRESWSAVEFMATLREYAPAEGASVPILRGDLVDARVGSRSRCGRVAELVVETTSGETILRGDRIRWALRRPGGSAILRSSLFKIGVARDAAGRPREVVVSGAGNGHGIGMCQHGAMGMAGSGKDYRRILAHYYKHAELERI